MMNEIEIAYWHNLNSMDLSFFSRKLQLVADDLLRNALFAKTHCVDAEQAQIFKTFIMHNYRIDFNLNPACMELSNQQNW